MSWLQLKLQMLPCISNEIQTNIKRFNTLVDQIDNESHLPESQRNAKLLQEYSRLRASMKARMEELAIFYNENLDDDKINFFEKLRLKIKKALFNRPGKQEFQDMQNMDMMVDMMGQGRGNQGQPAGDYFERIKLNQHESAAWEARRGNPMMDNQKNMHGQGYMQQPGGQQMYQDQMNSQGVPYVSNPMQAAE